MRTNLLKVFTPFLITVGVFLVLILRLTLLPIDPDGVWGNPLFSLFYREHPKGIYLSHIALGIMILGILYSAYALRLFKGMQRLWVGIALIVSIHLQMLLGALIALSVWGK